MKVEIISRKNLDPVAWDAFVEQCPGATVAVASWFIDTVTHGQWEATIAIDQQGVWQGVMPLYTQRKLGQALSRQPFASRYWGVLVPRWPHDAEGNYKRLHRINGLMGALLPPVLGRAAVFDYMSEIDPEYAPGYAWQGIELLPRFTYLLPLQHDMAQVRAGYSKSVRKNIQKLANDGFINRLAHTADEVVQALEANLKEGRQLVPPQAVPVLAGLANTAVQAHHGFLLSTYAPDGQLAAAGFFAHNEHYTHFMSGYALPMYRSMHVMNLLVDGALEKAAQLSRCFDFYGSSIAPIESFFRSFGPSPHVYYRLRKIKFPQSLIWNRM
ncbi:MAG: GNAT family N-acetyltransferase [Bacteroidetes bacterium]|nr:GNAT family N-acetyltransferase [Bacteroidota bacterium]